MSLMAFWKSNRADVEAKQISQVVAMAGDGQLKDKSRTTEELREYFSNIDTALLGRYLEDCLQKSFQDSGLVLQDIVNELGARLDCNIEHGRYRGKPSEIGFDGIWRYPNGYSIVVEVKTTDAYSIDLDTVAKYRDDLIDAERIGDESSILIVVGRKDTGGLEAQVRGSRHAWDIRIISADALFQLVETKEEADSNVTIEKIRQLLIPQELTKLDFIVELLATTAEDYKSNTESEIEEKEPKKKLEKRFTPVSFNAEVAEKVAKHIDENLKKKTRSLYTSPNNELGVVCTVSKSYETSGGSGYWYAFHPHQKEALENYKTAYVAFGLGDPNNVLLVPFKTFSGWLDDMNVTHKEDRMYWHVQYLENSNGKIFTSFKASSTKRDITEYKI